MKSLPRSELYNAVWDRPLSHLAKEWSTDPVLLARLCDQYQIPRPPKGYWTRQSLGRTTDKPELSSANFDINLLILLPIKRPRGLPSPTQISVPNKVSRYEPEIRNALDAYKRPAYGDDPYLVASHSSTVAALSVSSETLTRAARILNTLYKHARTNGWDICAAQDGNVRVNKVTIDGEPVKFRIREKLKRTNRALSAAETARKAAGLWVHEGIVNVPTGKLLLSLQPTMYPGRKLWVENDRRTLQECLGEFVDALVAMANFHRLQREERESQERQRQHEMAILSQVKKEASVWRERSQTLLEHFDAWQKANSCRQFIATVEQSMLDLGELSEAQLNWLEWARNIADQIDPINQILTADMSPWSGSGNHATLFRSQVLSTDLSSQELLAKKSLEWYEAQIDSEISDKG